MVQHCLPAYRGQEISEELFEAHADEIFEEAENRLHAQKAVMVKLLGSDACIRIRNEVQNRCCYWLLIATSSFFCGPITAGTARKERTQRIGQIVDVTESGCIQFPFHGIR